MRTMDIDACGDCPFHDAYNQGPVTVDLCQHPDSSGVHLHQESIYEDPPPSSCPMRRAPVVLRVKEGT